ncbi:hypothetical protein TNCV_2031741 [Trichonephila clavipes]|nr:hypothetical protein TNCV_2031741 [Trichonephila clavipes]
MVTRSTESGCEIHSKQVVLPLGRAPFVDVFREEADVRRIDRPSRSPNFNPIEHIYDGLGRAFSAGKYLEKVHRALLTVPPTSIDGERAFLTASTTASKCEVPYQKTIELLPWPASSPSISLIENVWSMLAQQLTSFAATPDELRKHMEAA